MRINLLDRYIANVNFVIRSNGKKEKRETEEKFFRIFDRKVGELVVVVVRKRMAFSRCRIEEDGDRQ